MDLAALLQMKFIFRAKKKNPNTLQTLLSSCCVIYVKLLVARKNRSRFGHIYYRKKIIDLSFSPLEALSELLLSLPNV